MPAERSGTGSIETGGLGGPTLAALASVFSRHAGIEAVRLFGSRAKGCFRPGSDIDLALFGETISLDELFRIESEIDDLLLPYKVDVVPWHHIDNPELRAHIERVGVVLWP